MKQITEEIWKDIPEFEGLYQVSNYGRVKACERIINYCNGKKVHKKEKILSLISGYGQYLTISLCKNKKHKTYNVHRLVAITFIKNPYNLPCINHKDEDKYNNRADNLEWCSYSYNVKYNNAMRIRLDTRNKNKSLGCEKMVYQYNLNGNLVKIWKSLKSIQRELGYRATNISACCLGKYNKTHAYGYKWSYIPM